MTTDADWIRFRFPCIRCGQHFRAITIQTTCAACTLAEAEVYPEPLLAEAGSE